jgi:hypothetical protein
MLPVSQAARCLLTGWLMLTAVGCATPTLNLSRIDFRSRKATARNPAIHIVCLWEPAEGRDPKGVPCSGFAGQILFLTSSQLPVSVDGDIKIYEFDDQGTPEQQSEPLHTFTFDSDSWNRHYTYGTLGPAYNVFVPYMRRGVTDATCALRVSLKPKNGPVIFSDMTNVQLLSFGKVKATNSKEPILDPRVEETVPEDRTAADRRRKTTTISLNPRNDLPTEAVQQAVATTTSDKVQQASHVADNDDQPRPLTAADVRIAELEKMVKELRAMSAAELKPAREESTTPPRRLAEAAEDASRIRVRAAKTAAEPATPKAPIEEASHQSRIPPTTSSRSARHPLEDDDETPVANGASRLKAHPLSDPLSDADDSASPGHRTAERPPQRKRHPLESLDDESPAGNRAPRTKPVANQKPLQPDSQRGSPVDPFDPIETEAIETTAVEETPIVRQKLRAVNQ